MTLGQYFKESAEDRRSACYQLEDVFILLEVEQLRKNYKFKITCNGLPKYYQKQYIFIGTDNKIGTYVKIC